MNRDDFRRQMIAFGVTLISVAWLQHPEISNRLTLKAQYHGSKACYHIANQVGRLGIRLENQYRSGVRS